MIRIQQTTNMKQDYRIKIVEKCITMFNMTRIKEYISAKVRNKYLRIFSYIFVLLHVWWSKNISIMVLLLITFSCETGQ